MTITDSETGQVIPIIALVRTPDDLSTIKYQNYDRIVVAVGDGKNAVRSEGVDAMLTLSGQVFNYKTIEKTTKGETFGTSKRDYVDVIRNAGVQPQYEPQVEITPSCEMKITRAMSVEQLAEFCSGMPAGVGEEEYLARLNERDDLGDAV